MQSLIMFLTKISCVLTVFLTFSAISSTGIDPPIPFKGGVLSTGIDPPIPFKGGVLFAQTSDNSTPLTIDKIVAIVNNEVITQSDVDRVLATIEAEFRSIYADPLELTQELKQAKENIIRQMVEEKLILSEAKKYEIKADQDKIDSRIEQIKQGFSSEDEFEQALAMQGLTLKNLRDRFSNQEIMKKAVDYFIRSTIKVDPIEIKEFYEANQKELIQPEEVKLKSIFIRVDESCDEYSALQKAAMVLNRLRKGDRFEDLVKEYSQGASASEGGNLGFIEKGQLIKEIDEAVFSLEPGDFTDAIKTPQGYRIFKVEEKIAGSPLSFSQAHEQIKNVLYSQKFTEAFKKWIDQIKQDAYISIKE